MNSYITGLTMRRFKVIIPTGLGKTGSLTGNTLTAGCFTPNRIIVTGRIDK